MYRRVHSLFFVVILAAGMGVHWGSPLRAQGDSSVFEACLDLSVLSSPYAIPPGWTICFDDGTHFPTGTKIFKVFGLSMSILEDKLNELSFELLVSI